MNTPLPSPPPLRIIFAGSGEFGVPTLRALHGSGQTIVQVYTQPDRPAGRGRQLTPTPIAQAAQNLWLPVVRTESLNAEALPPADMLVVIAFGQKISPQVADHPRLGSINLHASLLPRYRGAAPIHWAVLNGETITGNSVIRLASRMDAGAVLGQSSLPIGPTDTTGALHDRLAMDGAILVQRVLEQLSAGTAVETVQDESLATAAPKLSRQAAILDWTRPAAELARRINGLSPWPGCRVQVSNGNEPLAQLTLLRAVAIAGGGMANSPSPGTLDDDGDIAASEGCVRLLEIQPQGRRPMSLIDYRRGNPWAAGLQLWSI